MRAYGNWVSFMQTECCGIFLFVKSICVDLDPLSLLRHFLFQIATLLRADCSFTLEISTESPTTIIAASSTDMAVSLYNIVGTSMI